MNRILPALCILTLAVGHAQAQSDAPASTASQPTTTPPSTTTTTSLAPAEGTTTDGAPAPNSAAATTSTTPPPPTHSTEEPQFAPLPDENGSDSAPGFGENAPRHYQSPQRFAFEVKLGPYSPHIDDSKGLDGATPFKDLFNPGGKGEPKGKLLTELEFDWQFLHKPYGVFGIGHVIGYMRRSTHSLLYQNSDPTKPCLEPNCRGAAGDMTTLNVIPLQLLLVYRFEYLAERYHIPFIPYLKTGLAYYLWWIENGGGFLSIATYKDPTTGKTLDRGYGGTFGWILNPGGTLLLDVIDAAAARTLDSELGINHTYLFCELNYAVINNFDIGKKMNLSDTGVTAGIGFEF